VLLAVALARLLEPDIVVIDLRMPVLNGHGPPGPPGPAGGGRARGPGG
jgi:hypothetical protein